MLYGCRGVADGMCMCLCFAGIVRTSVIVTGVQVSSRIFMVWFITHSIRQVSAVVETDDSDNDVKVQCFQDYSVRMLRLVGLCKPTRLLFSTIVIKF